MARLPALLLLLSVASCRQAAPGAAPLAAFEAQAARLDGEARTVAAALAVLARQSGDAPVLEAHDGLEAARQGLHKALVTVAVELGAPHLDEAVAQAAQRAGEQRLALATERLQHRLAVGRALLSAQAPSAAAPQLDVDGAQLARRPGGEAPEGEAAEASSPGP